MHQRLGTQGQCGAGGSESHIWAHWNEAAQSTIKLLIDYLNFPWIHWNQLQRWTHTMEVQLALGRTPSLGCDRSTFWCHKSSICGSNMPDGLKHTLYYILQHLSHTAKPPNTRHVVNTELNPLRHELVMAKPSTQFKRSVLQFVWQINLFYSLMPTSLVHLNNTSLEGLMAGGFGDQEPELFIFTSLVWIQERLIMKENISHLPSASQPC